MPAPDPGSDGFKNIKGRGVIKTKIKKMTVPDRGIDMSDNKGGGNEYEAQNDDATRSRYRQLQNKVFAR